MGKTPHRIVRAWLDSPSSGIIELDRDWTRRARPQFTLGDRCLAPDSLAPAPGLTAGRTYGYFFNREGKISFVLPLEHECEIDPERDFVYLAGDFNDWQAAVGAEEWVMRPGHLEGERVLLWTGEAARFLAVAGLRFKFVTGEQQWLLPPTGAPNMVRDEAGNVNRSLDPSRTGWHLWRFKVMEPLVLSEPWSVGWAERNDGATVPLVPGDFFHELKTDLPLGALVHRDRTTFRLFAPRASRVTVGLRTPPGVPEEVREISLARRDDADGVAGVWETTVDQGLHGWLYWYHLDGRNHGHGPDGFDANVRILDPYALATIGAEGPGIILDPGWIGRPTPGFRTPAWQDLVIAEAHVRDLTAHAPVPMPPEERLGFSGLRRWVESSEFHLHRLGVNCVELQPVHEFDNRTTEEYHWGYMPCSYFAPESSYALAPERASGVRELQELVAAFHRRGLAVVLDVVFNHTGPPAHLMFIDRRYYFDHDAAGELTNGSGCGNDLRSHSAMVRRLIIDSCRHYLEAFGVDGFRFDLAELIGVEVLREIEVALKRTKPDVILIAEPWSFRGHIAGALRDTGWASWNDGFRDFVRAYVCGHGSADRMEYFLRGSPWYFAKWPAQTVNYTESHDDQAWIDVITEHQDGNGLHPTAHDRRRTHLMAALLFLSVGVPMIAAGQDFLRSKHGVSNTYQRGDLNVLDYHRLRRHRATHAYFAEWIAFRRSEAGRLLRHWTRPGEGFFRFFHRPDSPALAVLLNADRSLGSDRLLFAINPTMHDVALTLGVAIADGGPAAWEPLADHERFYLPGGAVGPARLDAELLLPSLSCELWRQENSVR